MNFEILIPCFKQKKIRNDISIGKVMGMHMCLLFCVLYADTLNGLIPGGLGVCNTSSQTFK